MPHIVQRAAKIARFCAASQFIVDNFRILLTSELAYKLLIPSVTNRSQLQTIMSFSIKHIDIFKMPC